MHEPTFRFTAKEVLIMIQALELARDELIEGKIGRVSEIEALREKLNSGGVK